MNKRPLACYECRREHTRGAASCIVEQTFPSYLNFKRLFHAVKESLYSEIFLSHELAKVPSNKAAPFKKTLTSTHICKYEVH